MQKKEKEIRYPISIRVTASEKEQIEADARSYDYLNTSKYIRAVLLNKKIDIRKIRVTEPAIRAQVNQISTNITKIGNNYNQVVKKINELSFAKKKNGDPVVNSKYISFYIQKLHNLTLNLKSQHDALLNIVENSQSS